MNPGGRYCPQLTDEKTEAQSREGTHLRSLVLLVVLLALCDLPGWRLGFVFPPCGFSGLTWSWNTWRGSEPTRARVSSGPGASLCLRAADTQISAASPASPGSRQPPAPAPHLPNLGLLLGFQPRRVLQGLLLLSDSRRGGLIYICLRPSAGPTQLVPMATRLMPTNKNRSLRHRGSCVQEVLGTRAGIAWHLLCDLGQVTRPLWASVSSSAESRHEAPGAAAL